MIDCYPTLNKCVELLKPALILLLIVTHMKVMGQVRKVRVAGKITGEHGMPIPGAEVSVKGVALTTIAGEKGSFMLKLAPGSHVLTFYQPGYISMEKQVVLSEAEVNISVVLQEDGSLMKEVNVTALNSQSAAATRSLMPIIDIPQSISTIGQATIQQQASFDLAAISKNIIGLNFTGNYSGAGSSQFFNARGFDLNESQNYRWNGVMVWNWGNQYADNVEQVEFLKGPNSILFGDVAPGGVINLVTKKPLPYFMANIDFKTGSWGLLRPALDITGPIFRDRTFRYRINTSYEKSNSFRDKVAAERDFIAPALAWDITPELSLILEGVFKKSSATDDAGLVSPDGTITGLQRLDPSLYLGEPSRKYLYQDQSYFSTLTYELNPAWRIKATAFQGTTKNRPFGLWFDQPDEQGDFVRREYGLYQKAKNKTLAVDFYGTFYTKSIKHHLLFGIEYQSTSYRQSNGGELDSLDINNIYAPVYGQSVVAEPSHSPFRPYITGISRKGFHVQDQLMFFKERLHLLLGLRLGSTRQGNDYIESDLPGTPYEGYTDDLLSKNIFTPRLGMVYKYRGHSLYASYSKGYEINSPDVFAQNYLEYASPPATLSAQFEFGMKMKLLNDKLGAAISVFKIDKRNPYGYVYLDPLNPNYDLYNVYYNGHHQSRGIEAEADGEILKGLFLNGGFAYTNTRVMEDPGYPTGNALPNAPKYSANGWLHYSPVRLKGFDISSGFFYKSSFFSSLQNDPNLKIPASYTWDAAVGYQHNGAGIQFNIMNITNQVSYLNPWQFNLFDVKPLRQFVITLNYRFSGK